MMSHYASRKDSPINLDGPISSFQIQKLLWKDKDPERPLRPEPEEQFATLLRYKRTVIRTNGFGGAEINQYCAQHGIEVGGPAVDKFLNKRFVPLPKGTEQTVEFIPVYDLMGIGVHLPDLPHVICMHAQYAPPTLDAVLPLCSFLTDYVMDATLHTFEVILPSLPFDEKNRLEPFVSIHRVYNRQDKRIDAIERLPTSHVTASTLLAVLVKERCTMTP